MDEIKTFEQFKEYKLSVLEELKKLSLKNYEELGKYEKWLLKMGNKLVPIQSERNGEIIYLLKEDCENLFFESYSDKGSFNYDMVDLEKLNEISQPKVLDDLNAEDKESLKKVILYYIEIKRRNRSLKHYYLTPQETDFFIHLQYSEKETVLQSLERYSRIAATRLSRGDDSIKEELLTDTNSIIGENIPSFDITLEFRLNTYFSMTFFRNRLFEKASKLINKKYSEIPIDHPPNDDDNQLFIETLSTEKVSPVNTDKNAENKDLIEEIVAYLSSKLSKEHLNAFLLRTFSDKQFNEIAEILGRNEQTVKSWFNNNRQIGRQIAALKKLYGKTR